MSEIVRITDQLKRAYEGEAWHGPALRVLLADVTSERAAKHPLAGAHSIWEIVRHIGVWEDVARRRLAGQAIPEISAAQDWPQVTEVSEAAWRKALEDLERGHRQLRETIAGLPEERLEEIVPGKGYSVYVMLHGVVQHDLYHAGQIAVLKKG